MRCALFALCAVLAGPGTASADFFLFHMTGQITEVSPELAPYTVVGNPFEITMGWRSDVEGTTGDFAQFAPIVYGLTGSILSPNDLYPASGLAGVGSSASVSNIPGSPQNIFLEIDGQASGDPILINGLPAVTDYLGFRFQPTIPISTQTGLFPIDLGQGATGSVNIAYRSEIGGFCCNWMGGVQGSIDQITRSHVAPEPATLLLVGLGGVLLMRQKRRPQ